MLAGLLLISGRQMQRRHSVMRGPAVAVEGERLLKGVLRLAVTFSLYEIKSQKCLGRSAACVLLGDKLHQFERFFFPASAQQKMRVPSAAYRALAVALQRS